MKINEKENLQCADIPGLNTAQAQEILGEILTNVLDASNELDKEKICIADVIKHSLKIQRLSNYLLKTLK